MDDFNAAYAVSRIEGVAAMFRNAETEEDRGNAMMHFLTVFKETAKAADKAGFYCDQ